MTLDFLRFVRVVQPPSANHRSNGLGDLGLGAEADTLALGTVGLVVILGVTVLINYVAYRLGHFIGYKAGGDSSAVGGRRGAR